MLVISCNVRGLGMTDKRRVVRDLVKKFKPVVLFLQETKLSSFNNSIVNSIGGGWLTKGIGVEAEGSAGGIITLWNEDLFSANACINNSRCIAVSGELVQLK